MKELKERQRIDNELMWLAFGLRQADPDNDYARLILSRHGVLIESSPNVLPKYVINTANSKLWGRPDDRP